MQLFRQARAGQDVALIDAKLAGIDFAELLEYFFEFGRSDDVIFDLDVMPVDAGETQIDVAGAFEE